MKEWFKYEFGYVNIDSESIYLTNTGNWSETKNLEEKTKKIDTENDNKSSLMIGFILVTVCIFAFLMFKSFISGKTGLTLISILLVGGYKLYEYLKTEIGAKFKIPISKVSEIKESEKNIEIIFTNGEGKIDTYKLYQVDTKGFLIMSNLKSTSHNTPVYENKTL